ncbi:MAG: hypothetical protein QOJ37_3073, partial [Pseudonocardiales bacterium]|nr:hypothetical protein [Pseudonocardiales bacterium]
MIPVVTSSGAATPHDELDLQVRAALAELDDAAEPAEEDPG